MVDCSASSTNSDADLLHQEQQQHQQQQQEQPPQPQQQPPQDQQQQQSQLKTSQVDQPQDPTKQQQESSDNKNNKQVNLSEELFSSKGWGDTPIRQDTPWGLPPSPSASTVGVAQTLPPGISQSGDSSRAGNDFQAQSMMNNIKVDNVSANGLANTLGHMNLGGSGVVIHPTNRFDQPWRMADQIGAVTKPNQPSMAVGGTQFANPNLMNMSSGGMPKSMQNSGPGGSGNGVVTSSAFGVNMQPGTPNSGGDFARAPGPSLSMMDNKSKPFGVANRSSTWSAFGGSTYSDSDSEWPKSSGRFDTAKPWPSSMLMKGMDENQAQPAAIGPFPGSFAAASKSPTDSQSDNAGIGTWSPVVKAGRPGSKWDGDGSDNEEGDSSRFDDGTAIWGCPAQTKTAGIDWDQKSTDANGNDKSRNIAGNNQAYRTQQPSSSASLLMSSNFSPPTQHSRNPQTMKQPPLSHNFEQSNALSSQANQPNRGLGLSSNNVPHNQQLKHMVQQIQLAVQAGHLNPQILNQPLAPVTLHLLFQLLQQIKLLHQYQMQASKQHFGGKAPNQPSAVNIQITKTKQSIINLQTQIAAQQAMYLKHTQSHNISSRQQTMPGLASGVVGGGIAPTLPPGISQSGDSSRAGNDFHAQSMINNYNVDNVSANGLANTLGHMNLGGSGVVIHPTNRFDQPWRMADQIGAVTKPNQPSMAVGGTQFANPNLMNMSSGGMPKSMLNSGPGGSGNGVVTSSAFGVNMQPGTPNSGGDFARAPGPSLSMMDNKSKPFGVANRSSTWSAFGGSTYSDSDSEWPKSSGISSGSSNQHNAADLVPEFEPGKPWRGSMLMKSVEDDPTMTPGSMARSLAPQRKTIWSDEML